MFDQNKLKDLTIKSQQLYKSLNTKPINEKQILSIIISTTNSERQIIRTCFKKEYNHPLQIDISRELKDKFKEICISMFDTPYEFDAKEIHKNLHSFINNDKVIIEIFSSRPKQHLNLIELAYQSFYKISLREDLSKETSDEYKKFLFAILDTERPEEQTISQEEAFTIAKLLKDKGIKEFGKNVELFKKIFLEKSREDLILISRAYNEKYKKNLFEALKSEVGGKNRKLIKGILFAVISPSEWFAKKLGKSIKGLEKDINTANRILISRAEIDMYAIRDYYFMEKNSDLFTDISQEVTGYYGEILANLSLK